MTFHEGKVWAVTIVFVNSQAAKVSKKVYTIAADLETAGRQVKEAMPYPGHLESIYHNDLYEGIVIGD